MPWYVFALVDEMPTGKPGTGLMGALGVRRIGSILAVVERRADVPPAEFGTLQRHQAIVTDLAARVPAILPVRFGTLLDTEALEEVLGEREQDVVDGFDLVRGRVQFTWRRRGARSGLRGAKVEARGASIDAPAEPRSGTDYLRRAATAAKPSPPSSWRALRSKLAPLVVSDRYQPASAAAPESLYHLVGRTEMERYRLIANKLASGSPSLRVTGPFPPFAFAPEFL
jgi:hypothetical protein